MPRQLTQGDLGDLLQPGGTIFVEAAAGEPLGLAAMLARAPELTRGGRFVGGFLPGVNRFDYALDATAVMEGFFPTRAGATNPGAGQEIIRTLHYSEIFTYLRDRCRIDIAFIQVAPPDAAGLCSLGLVAEFLPAVLDKVPVIVAEVSSAMPSPPGAPRIPYRRLDWVLESDRAPPEFPVETRDAAAAEAIARHAAGLIRDGDTIQIGLGRIQHAILDGLRSHRRLGLHSGLITDGVLDLIEAGAMRGRLTTGVALGTNRLYDFLRTAPQVDFVSVEKTHFAAAIAAVDGFVSINSALEIDLFGQVNAEVANGRRVSGVGGLVDFMRGARGSRGGRSILALPATIRGGASRIVPRLSPGAFVSATRADIDLVVTEYGVAALRDATVGERAAALTAIAAPAHQPALQSAWRDLQKGGFG